MAANKQDAPKGAPSKASAKKSTKAAKGDKDMVKAAKGWVGVLVSWAGALAIIGVFFKIAKIPGINYKPYMYTGFIAEAVSFVLMGALEAATIVQEKMRAKLTSDIPKSGDAAAPVAVQSGIPEKFHELIEARLVSDLDMIMISLTKEVDLFSQGLRSLGEEMVQAQSSVQKMHQTLEAVASGDLTENAKKLGVGMETLGTEMDKAGDAVVRMRSDLVDMATRFQSFNTGSSSSDAKPSA